MNKSGGSLFKVAKWAMGCLLLVSLHACRESLSPEDYTKCMVNAKKGPVVTQENKGFTYELQYRFPQYEALISMAHEPLTKDTLKARAAIFGTDHKFKLRLYPTDKAESVLKRGIRDKAQYFERIRYFSSSVTSDFALVTDTDTIYATHTNLERSYGLSPYIDLLISFARKEEPHNIKQLIFLDRALSKEKMEFDVQEITKEKNYPKLNI